MPPLPSRRRMRKSPAVWPDRSAGGGLGGLAPGALGGTTSGIGADDPGMSGSRRRATSSYDDPRERKMKARSGARLLKVARRSAADVRRAAAERRATFNSSRLGSTRHR